MANNNRIFISIMILVLLLIYIIENINGRFWLNDFKVFYSAAESLLINKPIYHVSFGLDTGYYKYSPFTLLLFVPLCLLPYSIAATVQFFLISICTLYVVQMAIKFFAKNYKTSSINTLLHFALLLCFIVHLVRELHLGNINMQLLALVTFAITAVINKKYKSAGLMLAIVILAKPYFIILLIPLFFAKRYKTIVSCIGFSFLLVLASILLVGFKNGLHLYQQWLEAMLSHNNYLYSNHTLFSIFTKLTGVAIPFSYSIILLVIFSILLSMIFLVNPGAKQINQTKLILPIFILTASIPNFLITDTEHFLLSIPLIAYLLVWLPKKIGFIIGFIVVMFFYGANSTDLLGKQLASQFNAYGSIGIANLIIIASTITIGQKRLSKKSVIIS
jgi:hypothetical protein